MEFIEYYQIIRSRIWIAVMMAAAALVVVTVYQILPTTSWPAEGQMQSGQQADWYLTWSGNNANMTEDREHWGTLEQFVTSRYVRDVTVSKTGVTNPDDMERTKTFEFERGKRGDLFLVRGWGRSKDAAQAYVKQGMQVIAESWNERRRLACQEAMTQLRQRLVEQTNKEQALRDQMEAAQTGTSVGRPTDRLNWVQGQINTLQGAIAQAKIDVGVAQDALADLNARARREESLPPDQRLASAQPSSQVSAMRTRLVDLELQHSQMLLLRTPDHPQVAALDRELSDLRQRLAQEEKKGPQGVVSAIPSALSDQISRVQLDLRQAERTVEGLVAEEAKLRNQVPTLLEQARQYEELENQLKITAEGTAKIKESLAVAEGELSRLTSANDLTPIGEAYGLPSPKTLPKYALMAVAASFAGFVMGCVLIFALHHIDLTFKNESEAEHLLGYPVIAGIPRTDITLVPLPPAADDDSSGLSSGAGGGSETT